MKTRFAILGLVLIFALITSCAPASLPGLGSSDPDVVATSAVSTLAAFTKVMTFGSIPEDTIYYGAGCKPDQPTRLILYFGNPETWMSSPSSEGGAILNLAFTSTVAFAVDSAGILRYPEPDELAYSTEMTSDGYRYAVLDLSEKTFTGREGWIIIDLNLVILRGSGSLGSLSTWTEINRVGQIALAAKPCSKVPLDLLYTGGMPTSVPSFGGALTYEPTDTIYKGTCAEGLPQALTVRFKPNDVSVATASAPVEYLARLTYTKTSTGEIYGDVLYPMAWVGGSDGNYQVTAPTADWTSITEDGTMMVGIQVRYLDSSSTLLYDFDNFDAGIPSSVQLKICKSEALVMACPADITMFENSPVGTTVEIPAPAMSGGCGGYSATCTPPSGWTFPLGVSVVGCTGSDSCGNHDLCSLKITILPAPPIGITCPDNISVTTDSDSGAVVTYGPPSQSGGCTNPTYFCTPSSGSTFPVGTTLVTCIASDTCLHSKSCTFLVAVTKIEGVSCSQYGPNDCGQHQGCIWGNDPVTQQPACVKQ